MKPTPSTAAWTAASVVVTERRGTTGTSTGRSEAGPDPHRLRAIVDALTGQVEPACAEALPLQGVALTSLFIRFSYGTERHRFPTRMFCLPDSVTNPDRKL